ncbi:hypothetical protein HID58_005558 [Brassica napus]|uniref:Uncharacterized protein n=1 Tax=Brassica napus TaxID=3708 RepID=A0ABQ8E8W8_BRANA|nr:hypothetical protein HID58_005558 [Brassica napus]
MAYKASHDRLCSHLSYGGRPASGSGDHASFTGLDRRLLVSETTLSSVVLDRRLLDPLRSIL